MMDPEEILRMLQGSRRTKRGQVVATLKADERAKWDALEGLTKAHHKKMKELELEADEIKLRAKRWWTEINQAYNLQKISGLQYDEEEGTVYELIPDNTSPRD